MNPRLDRAEAIRDSASEQEREDVGATDFVLDAGPRMIARSAELVQQTVQSGIEIAMRMTEYSAANIDSFVKAASFQHEVVRSSLLVFEMYADRMREVSILMIDELPQSLEHRESIDEEQMRRAA